MNICYIFGALDTPIADFKPQESDLIIAADGGYSTLTKLNIKPDLVVGDFDSLGSIPENENVVKHPVKKDDTDTLLAVKIGLEKGYKTFIIYGAIGGRLDHTVATIQTAAFVAERASSILNFLSFISISDAAPTSITATPPVSFASLSNSLSLSTSDSFTSN